VTAPAEIVERLWEAQRSGRLVPAPSGELPALSERDAYAIQRALIERSGERLAGWKVGMTSAVGRGAGAPGPIYGALLERMILPSGASIDAGGLHEPEVEGEIAFLLDRPLRGPGVGVAEVLEATRGVLPAIEVIAGRLEPGEHAVVDCIADNAFSALAIVGEAPVAPGGLDLRLIGMVHTAGGEVVGAGAGARVLGHPAAAVAWLANALAEAGLGLEAGQLVLSGSLAPAVRARAGDAFTVELDRLGTVSVGFS
jgi:2-keto-4-pentenoate hydratase